MPVLRVSDIAKAGVNTDLSPWELGPEFLTEGRNFRIINGKVRAFGGYENWDVAPIAFNPGYMQAVATEASDYWVILGRTKAYVFDGATWTDITSAVGYGALGADDELKWNGCTLGRIPVFTNAQAHPEFWSPQSPGQILQPVQFDAGNTWSAKGYTCKVIRAHKNFLIAMNLQEGVTELPDVLRWSHPADGGSMPFSWDETDPTLLAGKSAPLGSRIIDGLSLRDAFAVYSENAINVMDYTGDSFVFKIREMSSTIGLLSARCIAEVKGVHFLLADGDIVTNDGNQIKSIIHNRLRRRITANMNADLYDRSFVVRNTASKEIWFCVPEEGATYPNIAYIYNWRDDSWAIRDIPNVTHAGYGVRSEPATVWDSMQGTWNEQDSVWGSRKRTPIDDFVIGMQADSTITPLEGFAVSAVDVDTVLERTDFPLEGHDIVTTATRLYPHMEGSEPVEIQVGSQRYAGGPIQWRPSITFTPSVDRKIDIRTTGELLAWRITSSNVGNWAFSGMDIEYVTDGKR